MREFTFAKMGPTEEPESEDLCDDVELLRSQHNGAEHRVYRVVVDGCLRAEMLQTSEKVEIVGIDEIDGLPIAFCPLAANSDDRTIHRELDAALNKTEPTVPCDWY